MAWLKLSLCRANELSLLYDVINRGDMEFCHETITIINGTISDIDNNAKKFTNIAKYITFGSVCIEVALGFLTSFCFTIKVSCCTAGISCPTA